MARITDSGRTAGTAEIKGAAEVKGVNTDGLKTDLKSVRGLILREPNLAERGDISDKLDSIIDRIGLLQI